MATNDDFETVIDKLIIDTEAKLLAVIRTAISDTVEEIQTPVAKGGKMRVDTGFLRSSGVSKLGQLPEGPGRGEPHAAKGSYSWTGDALGVTLAKMVIGDTFYFGWTAKYAKYREAYDGFMESGLMNWQTHVDNAVARFRK